MGIRNCVERLVLSDMIDPPIDLESEFQTSEETSSDFF